MPSRELSIPPRLIAFLRKRFGSDSENIVVRALTGDASARLYFRCLTLDGTTRVAVVYPDSFELASFSYHQIYDLFRQIGVPVPKTEGIDGVLGVVLQEDLGDRLLQERLREVEPERGKILMKDAVDLIIKIQDEGSALLRSDRNARAPVFDSKKLVWELQFFYEHYLGGLRHTNVDDEKGLLEEFERVASELADYPKVLCHRDFHVRNILVRGEDLYVIDFQDARWGPPSYDLASLLKDSVELEEKTVQDLVDYYLDKIRSRALAGLPSETFEESRFQRQFHLMCIQRLLKALGTYGFQASVRKNTAYVRYIDGTLQRLMLSLRRVPEFPRITAIVEQELDRDR